MSYTALLAELEAIRARRRRREEQHELSSWLDQVGAIVLDARLDLEADLDRYDERQASRQISDAELDREERARDMAEECWTWERGE